MRACEECGRDVSHKRSDARFCDRSCKTKASDRRRIEDGRARERDRARYAQEAEHRKAYARQYLKDHPEEMRAVRRRRRAGMRLEVFAFTERDWIRLLHQYRHRCAYCGADRKLVREHVIPIALGGRHSVGNIVPACEPCNARKGKRLLVAFLAERR
jgi:5-methylcytosine-specific restriction endonuclease McrA